MRRFRWASGALGGLVLLGMGILLTHAAWAQLVPIPTVRVTVRERGIEALPLYVGLRSLRGPVAVQFVVEEVYASNPCAVVGTQAQAALTHAVDFLRCMRPDVVDAFNFYRRAPVALVADVPAGTTDLSDLVASHGTDEWSMATLLVDTVRARPGAPRLVPGGEGPGALAIYRTRVVDGVLATAPLPQYLAFSHGSVAWNAAMDPAVPDLPSGSLYLSTDLPADLRDQVVTVVREGTERLASVPPEDLVDLVASDFPLWEPDRLLAAVRAAREVLNPDGRLSRQGLQNAARLIGVPLSADEAVRRGATAE